MSLAANSFITALGTAVSALISAAFISLGARWLGLAEYGEVGAILSLANVFFLLLYPLEASFTLTFATLVGQGRLTYLRSAAGRAFRLALGVAVALLLPWLLLSTALASDTKARELQWLGVFCCAALATSVPRAVLRGREMFGTLALNFALESAARLLAGLALLKLDGRAVNMIAAYGVGTLFALFHSTWHMLARLPAATERRPDGHDRLPSPLPSSSIPTFLAHAYAALMLNLDVLAAKRFLSAAEAGLYAGASSISRIIPVAASPLVLVLFSRLASLSGAGRDTGRTVRWGASVLVVSTLSSLLIPSLFGPFLLRILLGEEFLPAHRLLIYQWSTACILVAHGFVADAMFTTSRIHGAWLFLVPALGLLAALVLWHPSALAISQVTLGVCATMGSAVHLVLWRRRTPALMAGRPEP